MIQIYNPSYLYIEITQVLALDFEEKLHFLHPNCLCFQANSFSSQAKALVPQPGSVRAATAAGQRSHWSRCRLHRRPRYRASSWTHHTALALLSSTHGRSPALHPFGSGAAARVTLPQTPRSGTPATRALPHARRPPEARAPQHRRARHPPCWGGGSWWCRSLASWWPGRCSPPGCSGPGWGRAGAAPGRPPAAAAGGGRRPRRAPAPSLPGDSEPGGAGRARPGPGVPCPGEPGAAERPNREQSQEADPAATARPPPLLRYLLRLSRRRRGGGAGPGPGPPPRGQRHGPRPGGESGAALRVCVRIAPGDPAKGGGRALQRLGTLRKDTGSSGTRSRTGNRAARRSC